MPFSTGGLQCFTSRVCNFLWECEVGSTHVGSVHLTGACVKGGVWVTQARWTDRWEIGEAYTDSLLWCQWKWVRDGVVMIISVESRDCLRECMWMHVREGLKDFCNRLEELVATVTNSNHVVFMRDQNANIRRDTKSWRGVIVRQEEDALHRNGCRLLSHYAANNWLIYTLSSTGRSINSHAWDYVSDGLEVNDRLVIVGRG